MCSARHPTSAGRARLRLYIILPQASISSLHSVQVASEVPIPYFVLRLGKMSIQIPQVVTCVLPCAT